MPLERLQDITTREVAQRQIALRYQSLCDDEVSLTAALKKMDAQTDGFAALKAIHDRLGDIPRDLVSRGGRFLPSGMILRDCLMTLISNALSDVTALRERRADERAPLEKRLKEVKAALADMRAADAA